MRSEAEAKKHMRRRRKRKREKAGKASAAADGEDAAQPATEQDAIVTAVDELEPLQVVIACGQTSGSGLVTLSWAMRGLQLQPVTL